VTAVLLDRTRGIVIIISSNQITTVNLFKSSLASVDNLRT
jgi:hypothetical protein